MKDHTLLYKSEAYYDFSLSELSSITSWLNPLFLIGYKRSLEGEDVDDVLPEYRSRILGETLQRCVCKFFRNLLFWNI